MKRFALLLALAFASSGCVRYGCAQLHLWEHTFDEQCGPAGSQGSLYFEDGMATLIIGADFEDFLTEESSIVLDYVPTVRMSFRSEHLAEGASLGVEQISVICGRMFEVNGSYATWSGSGTLEVLGPSNRTQVGGQSWRFAWDATCDPRAGISATGNDIIELFVVETGYDFELWGLPGDWPA